jgi:RNA polymerase sigma-70 factor (ECF subfamily)
MPTADNHDSRAALLEGGTPSPWLTDLDLARGAAAGDLDAFAALYARHRRLVYRFARALTGSSDAAQDITQEVFVRLLVDVAGRYDAERGAFTTYLYGIVRNLSRDRIRRHTRLLSIDAVPDLVAEQDEPHRRLQDVETAVAVRGALKRLPSQFREVILLCDLHELSYEQAAIVAGTSVGAVRSRLYRGRRLVREHLAHMAPDRIGRVTREPRS